MHANDLESMARPYAEALYELAAERGTVDEIQQELASLGSLGDTLPEWSEFLASPAVSREAKGQVLDRVLGPVVSELMGDFLGVLARKGRLELLGAVRACYSALYDAACHRVRGTLVTAVDLTDEQQRRVTERVSGALGQAVELAARVDAGIIGGMVLTVGDVAMDGSVQRSLERFEGQLQKIVRSQRLKS